MLMAASCDYDVQVSTWPYLFLQETEVIHKWKILFVFVIDYLNAVSDVGLDGKKEIL